MKEQWWKDNLSVIKDKLLPATWTHMANLEGMKMGFQMKLMGIDWRSSDEFGRVMVFFENIGLMQRNNYMQVRCNPNWEFSPAMFEELSKGK